MSSANVKAGSKKKAAICSNCTIQLVRIAYRRAPWFRLLRMPLRFGMGGFATLKRIDLSEYDVRTPTCRGCIRFYKNVLKEESATFRWLNDRVNPLFDAILESIVTEEERKGARAYARGATEGKLPPGVKPERRG